MSKKEIKNLYETLSMSGDLSEMFPGMTGEWKIDKDEFSKQYKINNEYLNDFDSDEDDSLAYSEEFNF
jgi:hypothetical protein